MPSVPEIIAKTGEIREFVVIPQLDLSTRIQCSTDGIISSVGSAIFIFPVFCHHEISFTYNLLSRGNDLKFGVATAQQLEHTVALKLRIKSPVDSCNGVATSVRS